MSGRPHLALEYPPAASDHPRWGYKRAPHPQLASLLAAREDRYAEMLERVAAYRADLLRIPRTTDSPTEPCWLNRFLLGLDAASLYAFLRDRRPATYLEVGSGNSTLFARRAKRDGDLPMRIVSLDPEPRREVASVVDELHRQPLEVKGPELFQGLAAGDIVFIDGSHRVFMNSDATTFFLELLPALPKGVLVGVHDILLPDDYLPDWAERYYSEQYLLAALLLAGARFVQPVLPCAFISWHTDLNDRLTELWAAPELDGVSPAGLAFWFETG